MKNLQLFDDMRSRSADESHPWRIDVVGVDKEHFDIACWQAVVRRGIRSEGGNGCVSQPYCFAQEVALQVILAQYDHDQVDPNNRSVANTLEQRLGKIQEIRVVNITQSNNDRVDFYWEVGNC